MQYLKEISVVEVAMIIAGVALFFVAAFVLWGWRWGSRFESGDQPAFSFPGVGRVSEPTRLLAGCFGILMAYHLVVWALPSRVTYVQFPRSKWWVVLVVGAGAVGGSLLLDKKERNGEGSAGD